MNYERIYKELTSEDSQASYTEKHHIIPKCMGGSDENSNLVKLTAREHYIAHKLLTKIYPNNVKLLNAHWMMCRGRKVTSRQFEDAKKSFSLAMKLDNPIHKMDREVMLEKMKRMREMNTGDKNIMRRDKSLREFHSKRMKESNPMRLNPELNRTAKPITVEYIDGTILEYSYAKAFSIDKGIPYSTVKVLMRNGKSSKKHRIVKITQLDKK